MIEPFLAEIRILSFQFAPKGWAMCNGQTLPINQNQALFSLLGTTFGGDGRTTFALPNLQGRAPLHVGPGTPLGSAGGESAHTLTAQEMPSHTHALNAVQADAHLRKPAGALPGYGDEETYSRGGTPISLAPTMVGSAGGGQLHSNMMPFLQLNFVIALQGIFPSSN